VHLKPHSQLICISVFHLACIGIGWALQSRANIAVTLVLNFFVGLAGASSFSVGEYSPVMVILSDGTATVFAIDMMPNSGGAVTASVCHREILRGKVKLTYV
jgi:hypothetical protein